MPDPAVHAHGEEAVPPPPRRGPGVLRVLAAALVAGMFVQCEGRRADSPIPAWEDQAVAAMQSFLPPGKSGPLVLESAPDANTRVFAPPPDPAPLPVELWEFARADQSILVSWPPGPVDLAMLLPALAARQAPAISLAQVPDWPSPPEGTLATRALAAARANLGKLPVTVALDPAFSAAPSENSPARFAQLDALDPQRVRGAITAIPGINDPGPWPPEGNGLFLSDFAFGRLVLVDPLPAPPGRVALPMLARAGDRLLPSQALLAVARARGIPTGQIDVHLGRAILAGDAAIPVDDRGCLLLPIHFADRVEKFSPLDPTVVPGSGKQAVIGHDALPAPALPGPASPATTALWTAAAIGAIEADDFALPLRILKRAPLATSLALAAALAMGAVAALWVSRWHRLGLAALLLGVLFLATRQAAASLDLFHGLAFPLSVWAAAFACALFQPDHNPFHPARVPATPVPSPPDVVTAESTDVSSSPPAADAKLKSRPKKKSKPPLAPATGEPLVQPYLDMESPIPAEPPPAPAPPATVSPEEPANPPAPDTTAPAPAPPVQRPARKKSGRKRRGK